VRPCGHCIPVPQDTPYVGPPHPDPEENISRLHLCHGVWLETSHPLLSLIGGGDLRCLCHLADHVFCLLGVLVGGPCIQTRIHQGGSCHMGFSWRPRTLHGGCLGSLSLSSPGPGRSSIPLWGQIVGGLQLLLDIMGGLHSPPPPSSWHHGGSSFSPMGSSSWPPKFLRPVVGYI
jgi:hypothetical protein